MSEGRGKGYHLRNKEYYLKNRDKLRLNQREYYQKNRDRFKERARNRKYVVCKQCGETEQHQAFGLCNKCYMGRYVKQWYLKNKDAKSRKGKEYYKRNKQKICERQKRYLKTPEGKRKVRAYIKEYSKRSYVKARIKKHEQIPEVFKRRKEYREWYSQRPETKKRARGYIKKLFQKYRKDPQRRLYFAMSSNIRRSLKGNKNGNCWENLAGYALNDLKRHLEKQFKDGMTWQNYGSYWHIDHRIPQSWFCYTKLEDPDFKKCWALENLQPKRSRENHSKNNRYAEPTLNQIQVYDVRMYKKSVGDGKNQIRRYNKNEGS